MAKYKCAKQNKTKNSTALESFKEKKNYNQIKEERKIQDAKTKLQVFNEQAGLWMFS